MTDPDLTRLIALTDAGDQDAAWSLLREARRRSDAVLVERARAVLLAGNAGLGSWLESHSIKGLPAGTVRGLLVEALGELAKHHANQQAGDVWNLDALKVWAKPSADPSLPPDLALIELQPAGDGWLRVRPDGSVSLPQRSQIPPSVTLYGSPPLSDRSFSEDVSLHSPEGIRGERRTLQADLYAFAAIGYTLWSGELPFFENSPSTIELMRRILDPARSLPTHLMADPSDDARILREVILRGLQPKAADRFPSALAMQRALSPTPEPPTLGPHTPDLGKTGNLWKRLWSRIRGK